VKEGGPRRLLLGTAMLFVVAAAVAPWVGPPLDLGTPLDRYILRDIRLPRVLMALACGAGLAAAGVVLQAILKNPLATPYTLGVASGAAFGVVLAIAAGVDAFLPPVLGRPLVGMAGAVGVIALAYRIAWWRGRLPTHTLLLAGVALTFLFGSLIVALQYTATPDSAVRILRWLVGSLETGVGFAPPLVTSIAVLSSVVLLLPSTRAYNAMAGGDEAALGVGVDVPRVVRRSYLVASLMVGVIVAFAGPIAFVGLIVPHALRLLGLVDNRYLLPASALAGGAFLAICDAATNLLPVHDLPVGVLTPMLGGPFFLYLLVREKRG